MIPEIYLRLLLKLTVSVLVLIKDPLKLLQAYTIFTGLSCVSNEKDYKFLLSFTLLRNFIISINSCGTISAGILGEITFVAELCVGLQSENRFLSIICIKFLLSVV